MKPEEDIFMMRREEIKRYQVIQKVLDQEINQQEAAEYLRITDRQIRRIVKRVREQGERGVIHALRGKEGNRKIRVRFKNKVLELYEKKYGDFGPTLATEKLKEREGIEVNDETLRLWLIRAGLWQEKKRRDKQDRTRRERKEHLGEMTQMDGSHHDWLEARGPKLVLMGHIDDATNEFYGEFHDYEGTMPAMRGLKGYIKQNGLPRIIYLDKHSTYKNNQKDKYSDWPFRDKKELTQFGRACKQLGIELIFADSPQAKGRIERVFKTLQDRLVKELRLANAKTLEEANVVLKEYLPIFNKKFRVQAKKSGDYHRPVDKRIKIDEILSVQTQRCLRNDRTVVHGKQWYQILTKTRADTVTMCEYLNGQMAIKHGKTRLQYKSIEGPLPRVVPIITRKIKPRFRLGSPKGSYWRDGFKLQGSLTTN
jgi:hypothetical protein